MHAQIGCPAQTEGALFTERRPKSSNQSCMRRTHTHTIFLPIHNTSHSGDTTVGREAHKHTQTPSPTHTRGSRLFTYSTVPASPGLGGSPVCVGVCVIAQHSTSACLRFLTAHNRKTQTNREMMYISADAYAAVFPPLLRPALAVALLLS